MVREVDSSGRGAKHEEFEYNRHKGQQDIGVAEAEAETNDRWSTELTMANSCQWLRRCSMLLHAESGLHQ